MPMHNVDQQSRGRGAMAEPQSVSVHAIASLGARIRRARLDSGLTLVDVSAATGLSVSMLSMLERGKSGVSIGSLVAVASALGVAVGDLFGPASGSDSSLNRLSDQQQLTLASGVTRRIVHRSREHGLEVVALTLEPGARTGDELVRHQGYEVVVVQEGALTVQIDDAVFELAAGDSIGLDADHPHRFANNGSERSHSTLVVRLPVLGEYGH
ncbi:transcriptional regulator [Mycolicibacterium murale]|uniref:Transcriptional regulator n=2 Tax=Mycolicibacterium murale TaxID=182220 RepID=A0A7I9WSP8_9MYCO|nr:transcriptional regulator [Mycolicibacterium murale]